MKTLAALLIWAASAGSAFALSCLPTTVESLYTQAAEAEEGYVPVVGQLSQIAVTSRPALAEGFPQGSTGTAWFTGAYVSGTGTLVPWSSEVSVEVACAASWCGPVPAKDLFLGFLRVDGESYHFTSHACLSFLPNPTIAQQERILSCVAGADCTPSF